MKSVLNIFFLFDSIISCIKIFSTKSIASSIAPFLMVIGIGLIMDAVEEIKRYRNDIITNNTKTKVYKSQKFRSIEWSKIKIGNLIKVKKDELIPADLLVICSSNKDISFYLQTSNLDGESSLKQREALIYTQKIFRNKNIPKDEYNLKKIFSNFKNDKNIENCFIEVEQPNKNIYMIDGNITFNGNEKIFFDIKNTAIRGTRLKNTNFIYGIVIYTGKETKIMKNIINNKNKINYLDKIIDKIVYVILIIRIFIIIIFVLIGIFYRYKYLPNYKKHKKIEYEYLFYYGHSKEKNEKNSFLENIKYLSAQFILTHNFIPTSVSLLFSISKIIQSLFIEFLDKHLRSKPNQKMKCFSTELLGELGSVKYIFSDKTGTLTKNETQFKACSIFTCLFDESTNNINTLNDINNFNFRGSFNPSDMFPISTTSVTNFSNNFNINNLLIRLQLKNIPLNIKNIKECPFKSQGEAIEEFVLNMALNHDIVCEDINGDIQYRGTNPDEVTLVGSAKELGYCFLGKSGNILTIKRKIFSQKENQQKYEIKKYEILLKIPFSSQRQRSSIIVKDLKNNNIKIYNKGSDTKIFEAINQYSKENILEITKDHVDTFARQGLRTLCYSFKLIPENEFKEWFNRYNKIKEKLKIKKDLSFEIENLIKEIEKNCFLLGATALEDQLQDNVRNDIKQFIEAGINFWMLTGDKMDTAESIGHSIKLFDEDTEVYKICGKNQEEIIERMKEIKQKIKEAQSELSNLNIADEEGRKEDINIKVDKLKKKMLNRIETIYEDEEKKENLTENKLKNKNQIIENGNSCKGSVEFSENRPLNSVNIKGNDININNNLMKLEINNFEEDKKSLNSQRKKSIPNMSIFKFMIDNQYFSNSNIDIENLSILNGKVAKPNLVFSNNSSSLRNQKSIVNIHNSENNEYNNNELYKRFEIYNNINNDDINTYKNDNIYYNKKNNISISKSFELKKKGKEKKLTNFQIPMSRNLKEKKIGKENGNNEDNFNNNYGIISLRGNNKSNKYKKKLENLKEQSSLESLKLTITMNKDNSDKELAFMKKTYRLKINLPTSAKEFLNYFNTCLEGAKEALYIQQKAFTFFKLPYLYGPSQKDKDPLTDDIEKMDWTEKLRFKNYLLHTKIKYSLIINGDSIPFCTSEGEASELFWFLIEHSRSIICCRCSPIQKSNIVEFVKKNTNEITLSIGDGENDVNMIKSANVGIGIFGKEGYQAAYNSDYAFNEFKYLRLLLFINGRFALLRNTYFLNMFFFKNFIYCFQVIFFLFFSLFSGTFFYDELYDTMFNTFTSIIPLISFSVIDEDINPKVIKYHNLLPDMYKQARDSNLFNLIKYLVITFISIILSLLIFFIFTISYTKMIKNTNGDTMSIYELIFNLYFSVIFIHFYMIYIDTSLINFIIIIFFIIQILGDMLFVILMNYIDNGNKLCGIVGEIINSNISFLTTIMSCTSVCLPFFILRRAELFFGINISNLIKTNKLQAIYFGKYYRMKLAQMIRATRAIAKFKRINKSLMSDVDILENNLINRKMRKIVEHYYEDAKNKRK